MPDKDKDWVVAIPSYDRIKTIGSRTLELLRQAGLGADRVFVFADPRQYGDYVKALKPFQVTVVKGAEGVCQQRNAIMKHFLEGAKVVEMDDDIEGMCVSMSPKRHLGAKHVRMAPENFPGIVDNIWADCAHHGCTHWGVYPTPNGGWMTLSYSIGLMTFTAQLTGYINPGSSLQLSVPVMEDYERSLHFFSKGLKCMRVNYLALLTKNRSNQGGCQSAFTDLKLEEGNTILRHPRWIKEAEAANFLKTHYPKYVRGVQPPKMKKKTVPVYGEVEFHGPGWRVSFHAALSDRKQLYAAGDFAKILGVPESASELPSEAQEDVVRKDDDDDAPDVAEDEATMSHEIGYLILSKMKHAELTARAKEANLPARASKVVLMERLLDHFLMAAHRQAEQAERRAEELRRQIALEKEKTQKARILELDKEEEERREREAVARELEAVRLARRQRSRSREHQGQSPSGPRMAVKPSSAPGLTSSKDEAAGLASERQIASAKADGDGYPEGKGLDIAELAKRAQAVVAQQKARHRQRSRDGRHPATEKDASLKTAPEERLDDGGRSGPRLVLGRLHPDPEALENPATEDGPAWVLPRVYLPPEPSKRRKVSSSTAEAALNVDHAPVDDEDDPDVAVVAVWPAVGTKTKDAVKGGRRSRSSSSDGPVWTDRPTWASEAGMLPDAQCVFWAAGRQDDSHELMLFLWDKRADDPLFDAGHSALSVFVPPLHVAVLDDEDGRVPKSISKELESRPGTLYPSAAAVEYEGIWAAGLAPSREQRRRAAWLALAVSLALGRGEVKAADQRLRMSCKSAGLPDEEMPDFAGLCRLAERNRGEAWRRRFRG
eukprot:TRINITY_DN31932_c0_g1_i1.p1 TRINITY_DN31932_c0_g1~~TRINITY_DN31932_c0_g1_i1.p1  ORF type:complete len:834 (-),score=137.97 TRINITY_DN31932_c0_g1_i1:36-2537(-)